MASALEHRHAKSRVLQRRCSAAVESRPVRTMARIIHGRRGLALRAAVYAREQSLRRRVERTAGPQPSSVSHGGTTPTKRSVNPAARSVRRLRLAFRAPTSAAAVCLSETRHPPAERLPPPSRRLYRAGSRQPQGRCPSDGRWPWARDATRDGAVAAHESGKPAAGLKRRRSSDPLPALADRELEARRRLTRSGLFRRETQTGSWQRKLEAMRS